MLSRARCGAARASSQESPLFHRTNFFNCVRYRADKGGPGRPKYLKYLLFIYSQ
jgi:hypothetical protein